MPKVWTYLVKKFASQFLLTLLGIITFLIVIKFNSIAGFATSGTDFFLIVNFVALLIPHVMPFAIPISALNAGLMVSKKLSHEKQFTALRSGGISIKALFAPLLLFLGVLCILNLFTSGTLAPFSKVRSKLLVYETTLKHPLFITQKACPIKIRTMYSDVGKTSSKDTAEDLFLIFKNKKSERLGLIMADKLTAKGGQLKGKNMAIVTSLKGKNDELADDLIIENESFMKTSTQVVDALLNKDEAVEGADYFDIFQLIKNINKKSYYKGELLKRLSLTLAPLSFGLLGLSFGLSLSRLKSHASLAYALALATLYMISIVVGRSLRSQPSLVLIIVLTVHALMIISSVLKIRRIERGIE